MDEKCSVHKLCIFEIILENDNVRGRNVFVQPYRSSYGVLHQDQPDVAHICVLSAAE